MVVLAVPVNHTWDFLVEGVATAMGWWTYDPGLGPVLTWPNGGRFTLLWTIGLMCVWPNLIAYWAGKPPVRGVNHLERFFRLARFTRPKPPPAAGPSPAEGPAGPVPLGSSPAAVRPKQAEYDALLGYDVTIPRWRFELYRFGAWFVVFQVSFFLLLIVPLVGMRLLTGHHSVYVP